MARSIYRTAAARIERRRRDALVVPGAGPSDRPPTIYVLAPDYDVPAGGIQVLYRHVDILNRSGLAACVLHQRRGFRCTWFENSTVIACARDVSLSPCDLVVVPEVDLDLVPRLPRGVPHVIFNQNSHLTWAKAVPGHAPGADPDLAAILTVSAHNAQMLGHAFPGVPIERVHLGIDPALFFAGEAIRARRLCYMPRRAGGDAAQLLSILRARGALDGWDVVALDGLSHREVAAALRGSQIFLSFTYQEGFGLPAAEAMAAGNVVVGYHGFGGREFFLPEFSTAVETGDVLAFALAAEEALRATNAWRREAGQAASRFIHDTYGLEREAAEVGAFYRRLVDAPSSRVPEVA